MAKKKVRKPSQKRLAKFDHLKDPFVNAFRRAHGVAPKPTAEPKTSEPSEFEQMLKAVVAAFDSETVRGAVQHATTWESLEVVVGLGIFLKDPGQIRQVLQAAKECDYTNCADCGDTGSKGPSKTDLVLQATGHVLLEMKRKNDDSPRNVLSDILSPIIKELQRIALGDNAK